MSKVKLHTIEEKRLFLCRNERFIRFEATERRKLSLLGAIMTDLWKSNPFI